MAVRPQEPVRKSLGLLSEQVMKKNDAAILELTGKIRKYQQKTAGEVLPSDIQFKAERLYNCLDYTRPLAMACLTVGILSFIFYCRRMRMNRPVCGKTRVNVFLLAALGIIAVYLLSLIGLRGFVSGHLPLSNGYETMQFLALCATLLTFIFQVRSRHCFRLYAVRAGIAGGDAGRGKSAYYPTDAGIGIALA